MHPPIELTLRFPPVPSSPAKARRELERLDGTVPPGILEHVRLLVTELVTNCVRHAGLDEGAPIELRVVADGTKLWSEISDTGPGFEADGSRPEPGRIGGWGLYLLDQLAERWGIDRRGGRTRVWFRLRCAPAPGGGVPGLRPS
jgi:anti-sigma regulatory factor (Ser/Thr protein kinase)